MTVVESNVKAELRLTKLILVTSFQIGKLKHRSCNYLIVVSRLLGRISVEHLKNSDYIAKDR